MYADTQKMPFDHIQDEDTWIHDQQIRLLYRNSVGSLVGTVFCAFVLVMLLWPVVDEERLILWLGTVTILTLLRLLLHQHVTQPDRQQSMNGFPVRAFLAGVLLSGAAWGAVSLWLFPVESMLHQIYIAFVLGGLCASAVAVYSPLPTAFLMFSIPALLPYLARVWMQGTDESRLMAGTITLFLLILTRTSQESGRTLKSLLELQAKNAELTRALHYQATHDSLVDLINHGEFQRRLYRLANNDKRDSVDYSLVFVDIDLFKVVNDTGGHSAGDALLREVARVLHAHTRAGDTAARVGGDEFALLLLGCPKERALEIAECIRSDIESLQFEFDGKRYNVAASLGVTHGRTGEHSFTSVIKAADAACYAAKEAGRNRVRLLPASDMFQTTGRFQLAQATSA